MPAFDIKCVTRNSPTFFTMIQKQETTKTIWENLKDIANRSDNIGIATVYYGVALISKS